MSIKAVLFDLDNTLTHRDLSVQAYAQHLHNFYKPHFATENEADTHQRLNKILELIRYIDHGGYPILERMTLPSIGGSVADALIKQLDWKKPPEIEELTQFWFENFGLSAVAMTNAEQVLKTLKEQNYTLAVISNGGHATRLKILEGLGFLKYFDEVFSSESVGVSKPKPEIFQYACEKLAVPTKHSLYIGDHPKNDYFGAKNAGLNALLLTGFHAISDYSDLNITNPMTITSLSEVFNYL